MTCKKPVTRGAKSLCQASERTERARATMEAGSVGLRTERRSQGLSPVREGAGGDYGPHWPWDSFHVQQQSPWRCLGWDAGESFK